MWLFCCVVKSIKLTTISHIQSRTVSSHRSGKRISSKLRATKYD
nr:MAG TPA: hypothetical protein [Caudoviricetes sp.]